SYEMAPYLRIHSPRSGGRGWEKETRSDGILTRGAFRSVIKSSTRSSATSIGSAHASERAIELCPDIFASGALNRAGCTMMQRRCESSTSWESRSTWRLFQESPFPGLFPGQLCLYGSTIGWTPLKNRTIRVRNRINDQVSAMLCACWKSRTGPFHLGWQGALIIDCTGGRIAILQTLRNIHFWSGTDLGNRRRRFPSSVPFIRRSYSVVRNCLAAGTS